MERMLDEPGIAMIDEAAGELTDDPGDLFDLSEQQSAAVGAEGPGVKAGGDFSSRHAWKFQAGNSKEVRLPSVIAGPFCLSHKKCGNCFCFK